MTAPSTKRAPKPASSVALIDATEVVAQVEVVAQANDVPGASTAGLTPSSKRTRSSAEVVSSTDRVRLEEGVSPAVLALRPNSADDRNTSAKPRKVPARLALAALALQVLAAAPTPAQSQSEPQNSQAKVAIRALEAPPEPSALLSLPLALRQPPYQWFASTDPKKRNEDYILLKPGETRRVPLAPGELERLWSTASEPDKLNLSVENPGDINGLRTVLLKNNLATPGSKWRHLPPTPLLDKTLLFYPRLIDLRMVSLVDPLENLHAGAALIATNRAKVPNKWFYQATVRPVVQQREGLQVLEPTGAPKLVNAQGVLKANESLGAVNLSGGFAFGVVSEVKITLKPATLETWNRCFVRGWATQQPKPLGSISEGQSAPTAFEPRFALSAPLLSLSGQFFGSGAKRDAVSDFDGKTLTLRWPLPFDARRDSPSLDIVNYSAGRVNVSLQASVRQLPASPPTIFHAHFGSALSKKGAPIPVAQVKGEGAFVGLAMGIRPTPDSRRRAFAYLEGNELMRADGKAFEGTGTEDFFNSAWYFPDSPFARPFGGATWKQPLPPVVAAYRWLIPDAVPFKREFSFAFEHGNRNNADDLEYRWLACFYASPTSTWAVPDDLSTNPDIGADPRLDEERAEKARRYILGMLGAIIGVAVVFAGWSLLRRSGK